MKIYKPLKGISSIYIAFLVLLTNLFLGLLIYFVNSYVILSLFRVALVVIDIYLLYYILLSASLVYYIDDTQVIIEGFWGLRKIKVPFENIEGYDVYEGKIRGVKLTGIGNDRFALGRTIIDKIGTTHMFVTSNKSILYLKTSSISYAVSPDDIDAFKQKMKALNIANNIDVYKVNPNIDLYRQKAFIFPFIAVTVVIIILTLNPFILYLKHKLPAVMPLSFDAMFMPIQHGTGKQFAFKQMTYGVLNMIILLCMYYASYFCAKYDRKTAYRYIYVALATSLTFLAMQIRILMNFRY